MLVSYTKPNPNALENLRKQMSKQSRGGKFMFNFRFDNQTSDKACKVLDPEPKDYECDKVIDDLNPNNKEIIDNVGRDI